MNDRLNQAQIRRLKQQLENRLNTLWEEIGSELKGAAQERFQQISGEVHDLEDESVADLFADLKLTVLDRHVQETRDINSALARIGKGTYAICGDCGEAIGFDRLAAYPTASRCVRCQDAWEKTHYEGSRARL